MTSKCIRCTFDLVCIQHLSTRLNNGCKKFRRDCGQEWHVIRALIQMLNDVPLNYSWSVSFCQFKGHPFHIQLSLFRILSGYIPCEESWSVMHVRLLVHMFIHWLSMPTLHMPSNIQTSLECLVSSRDKVGRSSLQASRVSNVKITENISKPMIVPQTK
jgi:hypothetical protein